MKLNNTPFSTPAVTPYITVITSSLNASGSLERCLQSVHGQELGDGEYAEHIIIDGKSTDGTAEIIRRHQEKIAYWVSEPDSGIYDAWNKALPRARGEWILFLGADDYLHDNQVLKRMLPALKTAAPEHTLVYGKLIKIYADGKKVPHGNNRPWSELRHEYDLPTKNYPPHPATFHHRSLFDGGRRYDETYQYVADNKLVGQVVKHRDPLFVDTWVTCFSMEGATNNPKTELERWMEKNRVRRELKLKIPWWLRGYNLLKVVIKRLLMKVEGLR